ncbi:hypothetical protein RRG08_040934 [Elysia crispata]|uniref:Uncharacterized protein n=1 Tax=Elysia crispata TaxID=231223 RepID=A0AAE0XR26_9GAST|nr:hypothetical protein RRG08_040934 [Elysia crispata]
MEKVKSVWEEGEKKNLRSHEAFAPRGVLRSTSEQERSQVAESRGTPCSVPSGSKKYQKGLHVHALAASSGALHTLYSTCAFVVLGGFYMLYGSAVSWFYSMFMSAARQLDVDDSGRYEFR